MLFGSDVQRPDVARVYSLELQCGNEGFISKAVEVQVTSAWQGCSSVSLSSLSSLAGTFGVLAQLVWQQMETKIDVIVTY
jgi:hypothetical protein